MKKLLGIVVLGLLLITNITQAKTIDAGNGITLDIPINYKYFEINYKKLKSLLATFPNLKKQISSKDFKEGLKLFGVGNNSKLTILVENQEALKLVKKLSTSKGMTEILKEFETLISEPMNELVEKMLTPDNVKKLQRMSEKEAEKWFEKRFAEPDLAKIIDQASTDALMSLLEKYKLHKYVVVIMMDKKMDNDLYNSLQTIGTNQCVFDFKCKNNKDFQQSITKETSNFLKKSPMYKDYSFEFNISETGANSNNDLFLYMQAIMIDDYSDYNSKGELFVSTKNEKIIFAGSTCFKNCDDFLKIIYEIFEPMGLLAKKIETKEKPEKKEKKVVKKKKEPTQTQQVAERVFNNLVFCKNSTGDIRIDINRNCSGSYKKLSKLESIKTVEEFEICYKKSSSLIINTSIFSRKCNRDWSEYKIQYDGQNFFYGDSNVEKTTQTQQAEESTLSVKNYTVIVKNKKDELAFTKRVKPNKEEATAEALKGCRLYFEPYGKEMQDACYVDSINGKKYIPAEKITQTDDSSNVVQQLKDLNELYESGALTKEEFEKAKNKLLN